VSGLRLRTAAQWANAYNGRLDIMSAIGRHIYLLWRTVHHTVAVFVAGSGMRTRVCSLPVSWWSCARRHWHVSSATTRTLYVNYHEMCSSTCLHCQTDRCLVTMCLQSISRCGRSAAEVCI